LQNFIKRHNLQSTKLHGESGFVDQAALQAVLPILQQTIAQFAPEDVYDMDEAGLYYCLAPARTSELLW
ncbi:hypothetical protein K457DRAFT_85114, partial [Linnemannia elongata AG-77]